MFKVLLLLTVSLRLTFAAPLYGEDGGYRGQASYVPFAEHYKSALNGEPHPLTGSASDGGAGVSDLDHTDGGYEIQQAPARPGSHNAYSNPPSEDVPKNYDVLQYKPTYQHGYDTNKIGPDVPSAPYYQATLYGQGKGGYKMADAYQSQHVDSYSDNDHDYKDDYLSYPQPYTYGYKLKDKDGNEQHREESSDGQGNVKGSYGYVDEKGTYRQVDYVADKGGFRANIKTNEPGTENQNPADVYVDSDPKMADY